MSTEAVRLLERIAAATERCAASLERMENRRAQGATAEGAEAASDAELDSEWGDPAIKKDPPRWHGQSFAPRRMSQCSPEYLDEMASFLDWSAGKADEEKQTTTSGKPVAPYRRKDAARARGWARRIRSGWQPPQAETQDDNAEEPPPHGGDGW